MYQLDLLNENHEPPTLWPFQETAVTTVLANLHLKPILVSPTGSGKTVMGCEIIRRLNCRALWLADRTELVEQAAAGIHQACGVRPGIIKAGYRPDPHARIQVASKDTLVNRSLPDADIVIPDECHLSVAPTFQAILDHYADKPWVGLTATPFRLDGKGLGPVGYKKIIVAAYCDDLVRDGFIHEPKVYVFRAPDLRGVRKVGGDYSISELSKRLEESGISGDIVETWLKRADNRRTVAFCVNIDQSQDLVRRFLDKGVPAEHLDGTTSKFERRAIADRLRSGETRVVSNVAVWTTGVDIPNLEICIDAAPTASMCRHWQKNGRIMRACSGKDGAIVFDHAGNHHMHGKVTRRITYSLDGRIAGESEPLGLRRCGDCYLLYDSHLTACPDCGCVPDPRKNGDIKYKEGEAVEFVEDYAYRAEVWNMYVSQAEDMGFKPGYAAYRYKERFGEWPLVVSGDLVDTDNATVDQKREVFRQLTVKANEKGFKPGWASYRYKDLFGCWPSGFVAEVRETVGVAPSGDRADVANAWAKMTGQAVAVPVSAPVEDEYYDEEEDLF